MINCKSDSSSIKADCLVFHQVRLLGELKMVWMLLTTGEEVGYIFDATQPDGHTVMDILNLNITCSIVIKRHKTS